MPTAKVLRRLVSFPGTAVVEYVDSVSKQIDGRLSPVHVYGVVSIWIALSQMASEFEEWLQAQSLAPLRHGGGTVCIHRTRRGVGAA